VATNDGKNRLEDLERATRSLQETAERAGPAAGASYTLIGAILLLGGIGYAIDRWRGTAPWFLFGGLMLGIAVGMYELAKTVWSGGKKPPEK
jgi:F0F1-type ATP synthase assembly protein I